jgi:16S rRNA (cytosine1402-N4)-methyltransferase
VEFLDPAPGKILVDATLGGGGHAQALAARLVPNGLLIGVDQDPEAIDAAGARLREFGQVVRLVHRRFDSIPEILDELGIESIDGAIFDLGVSSHQLDTPERGFSFKDHTALLDMRMNPNSGAPTAADILNTLPEPELTNLIRLYSDERWASRIARFAVQRRVKSPLVTIGDLVDIVHAAIPVAARPPDIHAATRTFQALRIAVNDELTILGHALESTIDRLSKGGVLTVLSYHSSEDRIVKQVFATKAGRGEPTGPYGERTPATVDILTRKPETPGETEVRENPRSRSAKLRAVRRL